MPKKKKTFKVKEEPEKYLSLSDKELISIVEKRLPEILKKKPSLKKKLKDLFSDVFVEKKDIKEILLELRRQREDFNKRFEATDRRFEEMRADMDRRFEAVDRRFESVREEMKNMREEMKNMREEMKNMREEMKNIRQDFHNVVSSVGSRWGLDTERMFREGLKEILGKYYSATVEEIYIDDREGMIKGYPARYQVDALITDGETLLIEVKAQAIDLDVAKLRLLGKIYEEEHKIKPRLLLLCAYAREGALEEAKRFGDVEIITSPHRFKAK